MKAAVIGIGSNSVRMLEAEIEEGRFRRLKREREGTRLFAGLDEEGNLTEASMMKTAEAVMRMAEEARKDGCEMISIFATSASRDARNGEDFLHLVWDMGGSEPRIISGVEEATLSFLGAADVLSDGPRCGMIDIGGGSTELVIGRGLEIEEAVSCQMGAVRLYQMIPINSRDDMKAVEEKAGEILRETLGIQDQSEEKEICQAWESIPEYWIGTGGTFTALAALATGVHWTDRTNMHGTVISKKTIREIGCSLADMSPEERLKLDGLQPSRADIVVHGICILLAIMDEFDLSSIIVSEYGNLEGYLVKYCL